MAVTYPEKAYLGGTIGGGLGGTIIAIAVARLLKPKLHKPIENIEVGMVFAGAFGLISTPLFQTLLMNLVTGFSIAVLFATTGFFTGALSAVGMYLVIFRESVLTPLASVRMGIGWASGYTFGFLAAYYVLLVLGSNRWYLPVGFGNGPTVLYAFAGIVGGALAGAIGGLVTAKEAQA